MKYHKKTIDKILSMIYKMEDVTDLCRDIIKLKEVEK